MDSYPTSLEVRGDSRVCRGGEANMSRMIINGGKPLSGEVEISSAKNAVLPALAACLVSAEECVIQKVPRLRDVSVMIRIIRALGGMVETESDGSTSQTIRVNCRHLEPTALGDELTRQMRSSIFIMGALLARTGMVRLAHPGGCTIGHRPINMHLEGLRSLGAHVEEEHGFITARADDGLQGAKVHLDFPSVGATENLMLGGVLARGVTMIHNAAKEPEIVDLQRFLRQMGARIVGAGTGVIRIEGRQSLKGAVHNPIPDRIEAGTFAAAAAATGGRVRLLGARPHHMEAVLAKLQLAGASIDSQGSMLEISGPARPEPCDLKTQPYPGFPTDMQNQFLALLLKSTGISIIKETMFENRFKVADEFRRMGADVRVEDRLAIVRGVRRLTGATVEGDDLRGAAALVVAGLSADGQTQLESLHHLDRGYAAFTEKLTALGAEVKREGGS